MKKDFKKCIHCYIGCDKCEHCEIPVYQDCDGYDTHCGKYENHWEDIFEDFLDLIEFTVVKYKNGWGVIDRQGGNLADIEAKRFSTSEELVKFFADSIYLDDYIIRDLEELYFPEFTYNFTTDIYEQWLDFYNTHKKLCKDSEGDFEIIDMFLNHTDEINLEHIYYENKENEE